MIYSKNLPMTTSQLMYQSAETIIGSVSSSNDELLDEVYPLLLEMENIIK